MQRSTAAKLPPPETQPRNAQRTPNGAEAVVLTGEEDKTIRRAKSGLRANKKWMSQELKQATTTAMRAGLTTH